MTDFKGKMRAKESVLDVQVIFSLLLRKNHRIKLPDAIIAATALTFNLTLISRNKKDFKNINNLKFVNPFDL